MWNRGKEGFFEVLKEGFKGGNEGNEGEGARRGVRVWSPRRDGFSSFVYVARSSSFSAGSSRSGDWVAPAANCSQFRERGWIFLG